MTFDLHGQWLVWLQLKLFCHLSLSTSASDHSLTSQIEGRAGAPLLLPSSCGTAGERGTSAKPEGDHPPGGPRRISWKCGRCCKPQAEAWGDRFSACGGERAERLSPPVSALNKVAFRPERSLAVVCEGACPCGAIVNCWMRFLYSRTSTLLAHEASQFLAFPTAFAIVCTIAAPTVATALFRSSMFASLPVK